MYGKAVPVRIRQVAGQVPADVPDRADGNYSENQRADEAGTFGKFFVDGGSARNSRSGRRCGDGGHKTAPLV